MDKIKRYLEENKFEMLELLERFVAQKSVYLEDESEFVFGQDVHQMLNLFFKEVAKFDFDCSGSYEDYYGWVEVGDPALPLIGIIGHLDVVDYEEKRWQHNPLGEFDGETFYGRGVVDNKGPVVQALYVMKYIKENDLPLRVRLIVGMNEETDFLCMKKYVENEEEMPDFGIVPDAKFPYIISEKGIINMTLSVDLDSFGLKVAELRGGAGTNITPNYAEAVLCEETQRGSGFSESARKIVTYGVASHVGNDSKDANAIIELLSKLGVEKERIELGKSGYLNSFLDRFNERVDGNRLFFEVDREEVIVKPTFLLKKSNFIEITLDSRVKVGLDTLSVRDEILKWFGLDEAAILRINRANGYAYERDNPIIRLVDEVYKENIGHLRPELAGEEESMMPLRIGGTTYGKYFPNCVVFGPGLPGEHSFAHREDERITVKSFLDGIYMYIKLMERFVGFEIGYDTE